MQRVFQGFELADIDLDEGVRLRARWGGDGPQSCSCMVIHAHTPPGTRSHPFWRSATVVCPDLRGYGRSTLSPTQPDHAQSSKRAMAGDVVALMQHMGHERFAVVGHDRGALVAFRVAMDHPRAVTHLVLMDGLPVLEHLERTNVTFAMGYWHWWFLGQTEKPAENVICTDPDAWYRTPAADAMGAENHADVWASLRDPSVVHGMCEDYRAGLGDDRVHDEADRVAGRQVTCPTLRLEAREDDLDIHGDPVAILTPWVETPLRHRIIDSGHHQAEEAPDEVADALAEFLAERS